MEKNTPHCKLHLVRKLVKEGKVRATFTALSGAAALGLDFGRMITVVNALTARDFSKSMTAAQDHRVWQDVYKPVTDVGPLYLKLTITNDVLIVSFKEL